eukprot:COSAG01_NODE_21444_length_902_cov_0.823163_1_plen_182_part_10
MNPESPRFAVCRLCPLSTASTAVQLPTTRSASTARHAVSSSSTGPAALPFPPRSPSAVLAAPISERAYRPAPPAAAGQGRKVRSKGLASARIHARRSPPVHGGGGGQAEAARRPAERPSGSGQYSRSRSGLKAAQQAQLVPSRAAVREPPMAARTERPPAALALRLGDHGDGRHRAECTSQP